MQTILDELYITDRNDITHIAKAVVRKRKLRNLTKKDLVEYSGVSIETLNLIESGDLPRVSVDAVKALAKALSTEPRELIGRGKNRNHTTQAVTQSNELLTAKDFGASFGNNRKRTESDYLLQEFRIEKYARAFSLSILANILLLLLLILLIVSWL